MKCLVVVAHPLTDSFCHALTEASLEALKEAGHEHRLADLYRSGFSPCLTAAERASYYQDFDASALTREIDDLLWAEAVLLIFPTWWFGPPAILKGWFDRVWAPGVAYDHAGDLGPIKPRLGQLKQVLAITTMGSPWWVDHLVLRRPVRRVLKTAILQACAPQADLTFISFYKAERIDAKFAAAAMARVRAAISRL